MPLADPSLDSPYAPPRAGRLAGFWRLWFSLVRRSRLGGVERSPVFSAAKNLARSAADHGSVVGAVIVPTLGFYLLPHPLWRRVGPAVFWVALFFALTEYGRTLGSAAFGLAAATHGIGAAACLDFRVDAHHRYLRRVFRRVFAALAAALVLTWIGSRVVSPFVLAVSGKDGRPVLVSVASAGDPARVGELVAYRLPERGYGGIYIRGGVYWGKILAVPPSQLIVFEGERYLIDRAPADALPHMPSKGRLELAPDHLFIWPEVFHFQGRAALALPAEIGLVDHSALVGRAYKRWFWHTQSP